MGFLSSRKLIDPDHHASAPITETLEKICEFHCDPSNNGTFCPSPCFTICANICNDDLSSLDPPPSSDSRSFHPSHLFVASFSLLAFALIALFCYGLYYRRFRRSRRPRVAETRDEFLDEDQGPAMIDHPIWYINTVGLPAAVIESIAVFKYRKGDGLVDGSDCSVCLSEFQEDETLRLLPKCSHAFHISCIDKWLRSHINCPMCRAPVAAVMPGESGGSPETRLDIPRQNEQEQHVRSPPGSGNGGGERRPASLVSGSGSPEEANSDPKRVGRSQSLLRFVGSSLQSGPAFLKRSVSCYAGDLSSPSPEEEESSGSSTGL